MLSEQVPRAVDPSLIVDFSPFDPAFRADPHSRYEELLARSPGYLMLDGVLSAFVARAAHVTELVRSPDRFLNSKPKLPGLEKVDFFNGMTVMPYADPPVHTRLRKMVAPAFSPKAFQAISAEVDAQVDRLLDELDGKDAFDLVADVADPVSMHLLLDTLLDMPPADWPLFKRITVAQSELASTPAGQPKPASFTDAWQAGIDYCERLIADPAGRPPGDLVGSLIAQGASGALNSEELLAMLLLLFTAGLNTISSHLCGALLTLLRHPDQLKLLREQPSLAAAAVEECLRYDAPNTATWRFAAMDTEIAGLPVTRDMPIYIMNGAANFDAAKHADPFRFDITRRPSGHASFGEGLHFCLGAPLARMASIRVLTGLIQRFPGLRLADEGYVPEYEGTPTVRRVKSMPLQTR